MGLLALLVVLGIAGCTIGYRIGGGSAAQKATTP